MARSYHWHGDSEVRCPYYKGGTDREVRCEGPPGVRILIVGFATREDRRAHMARCCTTYEYGRCAVARMIEDRYKEAGSE